MTVPAVEVLSGGRWIGAEEWCDVANPADTRVTVARVPALSPAQVTATYDAAQRGFAEWRRTSPFRRADILRAAAKAIRDRTPEIARDVVAENGKTIAEATGETGKAADFLEYYAGLARDAYGSLLHDARPGTRASVQREPIGVVLAITPWNDPLLTPARKLAPALMCGNSVVLKPATETPLSGLHLVRALHDAGIPAGVVNVVTGRTAQIADALVTDERIAAITFTGSNEVGERLRVRTAQRNIRFQAEMGGKNATVVLGDADLDAAVAGIVAAAFGQAGQRCTATSRVLVHHDIYDDLLTKLIDAIRLGVTMGPLISQGHRASVLDVISHAVEQGATLVTGGTVPEDAYGCVISPAVLTHVTADMDIWRQEVFGPVIAMSTVDGLDDAIAAVNDSDFGLAAAVYTDSLTAATRFADEVDCGQVAVNTTTSGWDVHHPFGGFRQSGSPFKEQGEEAVRFYTRVKTVAVHLSTT
jgi:acyl-CoA reductase-like NAD-dependent aldehyde dehydrogenase